MANIDNCQLTKVDIMTCYHFKGLATKQIAFYDINLEKFGQAKHFCFRELVEPKSKIWVVGFQQFEVLEVDKCSLVIIEFGVRTGQDFPVYSSLVFGIDHFQKDNHTSFTCLDVSCN